MKRGISVVVLVLAVVVLAGSAQAASPLIKDIMGDPQRWSKEQVSVFGAVSNPQLLRLADQKGVPTKYRGEYTLTDQTGSIQVKTPGNPPMDGKELWVRAVVESSGAVPMLLQKRWPPSPLLVAAVAVLVALAVALTWMLVRPPGKRPPFADTIPCPSCGMANELGSSFCQFCGKPMALVGPPLGPDVETGTSAAEADDRTRFFPPDAPSVADLTVIEGNGARLNTQFPLTHGKKTRIGRRNPSMDIQLDGDDMVSHEHAAVWWDQNAFYIQDLSSTNGTFVNGQRVMKHGLMDNDEIQLGRTKLVFRMIGGQKAGT